MERDRREARPDGTILGSATRELRLAIEATASRVTVAAGTPVFDHGDPGDALYVIEKGEVEISVHSLDGRKLALDVMGEGEVFGEIALFGGNRTAAAAALTDCVLRRIRRSDVMAAVRKDPELAFDFIDVLCGRLRALSEKLEERSFLPVPVRLANRLVYLDRKFGAGGPLMISQSDLAELVGATREAVAKTLAVWRARGWIALGRGSIQVVQRDQLEGLGT